MSVSILSFVSVLDIIDDCLIGKISVFDCCMLTVKELSMGAFVKKCFLINSSCWCSVSSILYIQTALKKCTSYIAILKYKICFECT